jgi:protein-tyrosine phosphatase
MRIVDSGIILCSEPRIQYLRIITLSAEIIKIKPDNYSIALLEKPARILASGGLVVFPTETVYGLGVDSGNPSAVARFRKIKNSPPDRPFTYHLADIDDVYRMAPGLSRLAKRLILRFMPGPLTLVLPGPDNKWLGVRVPDNKIACDLFRMSGVRVIASSANLNDDPPPDSAANVTASIKNQVDILIDGGAARFGASSTVLRVGPDDRWEILRPGSVTPEDVRKLEYQMILFVCTGNTCRSPMAEGLFKKMLARKLDITEPELEGHRYKIISAGTGAVYDMPASSLAVDVMREVGVDINLHRSQPLTLTMLEDADRIYVMTRGHLATIQEWMPEAMTRTKLLDPAGDDIADPIGHDITTYRASAFRIKKALERLDL